MHAAVESYRCRTPVGKAVNSVDEVTMPEAAFDALMQQISTLQATVDRLTALLEEKEQIIRNQNRARFGQSSEKRTYVLHDGQLSMFEQVGDGITEKRPEDASSTEKKAVSVAAHTRKPKRTLEELAGSLPEEPVILDLPDAEKYTQNGRPLKYIGTDWYALIGELRRFDVHSPLRQIVEALLGQIPGKGLAHECLVDLRRKTVDTLAAAPDVRTGHGHQLVHARQVEMFAILFGHYQERKKRGHDAPVRDTAQKFHAAAFRAEDPAGICVSFAKVSPQAGIPSVHLPDPSIRREG